MTEQEIVKMLVAERKRQGKTQAEIAAALGINTSYVQRIEYAGTGDRKVVTYERYAQALGKRLCVRLEDLEQACEATGGDSGMGRGPR